MADPRQAIARNAARGIKPVKLNLGSNRRPLPGYVNVDIAPYPGVDRVADVCQLPFDDESCDEIYAGHLFEHMENPVKFLLECWRVLIPGGQLALVVPNIACNRAQYSDRIFGIVTGLGFAPIEMVAHNAHDVHHTFWTPVSLAAFVTIFGFEYMRDIDLERDGRVTKSYLWQFGQEFIKVDFSERYDYQAYVRYRETLKHE